ncbi:MAG: Sporulation and spore germination, partial [Actinomycetota bacterium]
VRVRLEIPSPTNLQGVFTALIAGLPDPAHSKVKTLLPPAFSANVEVVGGVANVNSKRGSLDAIKPNEQRLAIAQIVLTLTSQPGIGQVTFSVGGKPIGVPRGRGDIAGASTPVTFDDYKMLITK